MNKLEASTSDVILTSDPEKIVSKEERQSETDKIAKTAKDHPLVKTKEGQPLNPNRISSCSSPSVEKNTSGTESLNRETFLELEEAIAGGRIYAAKRIFCKLSRDAQYQALCSPTLRRRTSLIALAAFFGHERIVDFLIDAFQDQHFLCKQLRKKLQFCHGCTPLYIAAQRGHLEIVKKLLGCFESKEERLSYQRQRADLYGQNALDIAAGNNHSHVVEYFLSQIESEDELYTELCQKDGEGRTPLIMASLRDGSADVIHVLMKRLSLEHRAAYLQIREPHELTALFAALQIKNLGCIRVLLSYCSEFFSKASYVSCTNRNGDTVLHAVAEEGDIEATRALLSHLEEDPQGLAECLQAKNRYGLTPLHIAINAGHIELSMLLLKIMHDRGLDMARSSLFKETFLHSAAEKGNLSIFSWYIEHAPGLFAQKNLFGWTPIDICLMYRQEKLLQLIEAKGMFANDLSLENSKNSTLYGAVPAVIAQHQLCEKILAYLNHMQRLNTKLSSNDQGQLPSAFAWNPEKKIWDIPGLCMGLSVLKAYYARQNKTDHFYRTLIRISQWDESAQSLKEPLDPEMGYANLGELMEQWINDLFWFQQDESSSPYIQMCAQDHIQEKFAFVSPDSDKKLQQEGDLKLELTYEQLKELLQLCKHRLGCSLLLWGEDQKEHKHVTYVRPSENGWGYYDSNYLYPITESIDDACLLDLLTASFFFRPTPKQMKISLIILTFSDTPSDILKTQDQAIRPMLDQLSSCGWTPLHKAQFAASPIITMELLHDPLHREEQLFAVDQFQNTPLHIAVGLSSKEKIEALLSPLDPSTQHKCLIQKNAKGYTPLMLAVIKGDAELTRCLLQFGEQDRHFALKSMGMPPYGSLLQHVFAMFSSQTAVALYETLIAGMPHDQALQWLRQIDAVGSTLFHYAAYQNNQLLLDHILKDLTIEERRLCLGDINQASQTALDVAQRKGNSTLYRLLLQKIL